MSDEIYLHFSEQRKARSEKRKSSQRPWNFQPLEVSERQTVTNPLTHCVTCGTKMAVTETVPGEGSIFRMRKCLPCDWIVVTEEIVADVQMIPYSYRKARRRNPSERKKRIRRTPKTDSGPDAG